MKKRSGFNFDQSERRNEFLIRAKLVSPNHKPRFKRIVFSRRDVSLLTEFLNSKNESRRIEEIPPKELNEYISEFIIAVRRKDGDLIKNWTVCYPLHQL